MTDKEIQDKLRPLTKSIPKFVPTNRSLLNFVNSKAKGKGIDLSFNKVAFLNKAEKSTYTCMNVELNEFRRHLQEINTSDEDYNQLFTAANGEMATAKKQVEKVYGEVRRYVITSEIRGACVEKYFKKIPSLDKKQNLLLAKEIFTLAYEENMASEEHDIKNILHSFTRINKIALALFAAVTPAQ